MAINIEKGYLKHELILTIFNFQQMSGPIYLLIIMSHFVSSCMMDCVLFDVKQCLTREKKIQFIHASFLFI